MTLGKGGRLKEGANDEYCTPPAFAAFWIHRETCTIDLAASFDNSLCERYFDKQMNALKRDWAGHEDLAGWCNPPYGQGIIRWVEKAFKEHHRTGFKTVFLLPAGLDTEWYERLCMGPSSRYIITGGRISFVGADGEPEEGNTRGSLVAVVGAENRLSETPLARIMRSGANLLKAKGDLPWNEPY